MKTLKWRLAVRTAMLGVAVVSFAAAAAGNVPSFKDAPKIRGDAEFCMDQQDGVYAHPDCRAYYRCEHQRVAETNCPDGQVFDSSANDGKSYCAAPSAVAHYDCSDLALRSK